MNEKNSTRANWALKITITLLIGLLSWEGRQIKIEVTALKEQVIIVRERLVRLEVLRESDFKFLNKICADRESIK